MRVRQTAKATSPSAPSATPSPPKERRSSRLPPPPGPPRPPRAPRRLPAATHPARNLTCSPVPLAALERVRRAHVARLAAASGQSHSSETATSDPARSSEATISVELGRSEPDPHRSAPSGRRQVAEDEPIALDDLSCFAGDRLGKDRARIDEGVELAVL